jgi:uncharacterized membrane protein YccF (DUF307 family)
MSDTNQAEPAAEPTSPVAAAAEPVAAAAEPASPVAAAAEPASPVAAAAEPASPVAAPPTPTVNAYEQTPQMVVAPRQGPGFLARAVWFIFVGWWLTAFMIVVAYALALSILGLPFAFYLFNRIPAFLTLRGRSKTYQVETTADGRRYLTSTNTEQLPIWLRAIWFVLVGFWLGAFWMAAAYVLCVLIVTMPFGIAMFNRVGAVMTLMRY